MLFQEDFDITKVVINPVELRPRGVSALEAAADAAASKAKAKLPQLMGGLGGCLIGWNAAG